MNTTEVRAAHTSMRFHQARCNECLERMPCPALRDADAWDALTERVRLAEAAWATDLAQAIDDKERIEAAEARVATLEEQKDAAYRERNALVAALSRLFPSHLMMHPAEDTGWGREWMTIVCVHITERERRIINFGMGAEKQWVSFTSQATWHIHDSEVADFAHLIMEPNDWDGHSTEQKYERLKRITGGA